MRSTAWKDGGGHRREKQSANLQILYHGTSREGGHAAIGQENGNYHHLSYLTAPPTSAKVASIRRATPTRQGCGRRKASTLAWEQHRVYEIPSPPQKSSSDGSASRSRIMAC